MNHRLSHIVFRLLGVWIAALWIGSCTDVETGTQTLPEHAIRIDDAACVQLLSADGGECTVDFGVEGEWRARVAEEATAWCRVSPTYGGTCDVRLTLQADPNASSEERNATVTLQSGEVVRTIVVMQKGVDALTVTQSRFVIDRAGGEVSVELQANVACEYEVDAACREWVEEITSRAEMQRRTLRFRIAAYDGGPVREGRIHIVAGDRSEQVRIYQVGSDPVVLLSETTALLGAEAATVRVEVSSNVACEVEMPAAEWITDVSTRVMSSQTRYFDVAANPDEEDRTAVVRFVDRQTGAEAALTVTQRGRDVWVVAEEPCYVSVEGGYVRFGVRTNRTFEVEIPVSWIERVEQRLARAETRDEEVLLRVAPFEWNNGRRRAVVRVVCPEAEQASEVEIIQTYDLAPVQTAGPLLLPWEGGSCTVEVRPDLTVEYACTQSDPSGWLRYAGRTESRFEFRAESNERTEVNVATLRFRAAVDGTEQCVEVRQMPRSAIVLAAEVYDVPNEGAQLDVEVARNVGFTVGVSEEWVTQVVPTTRGMESERLRFDVAPNPTCWARDAEVVLTAEDGSGEQRFRICQLSDESLVLSERRWMLPAQGGEVGIRLRGGEPFEVEVPAVEWLRVEPSVEDDRQLCCTVGANAAYESRVAEVVVRNAASGWRDTVRIAQTQCDAIVLAESVYRMGLAGGLLDFEVEANIPFEIEIEEAARGWLSLVETRALEKRGVQLAVASAADVREGVVTLRGGGAVQRISVLQGEGADFATIERRALEALYEATGGAAAWKRSDHWATERPLSEWYGVTTVGGRVTELCLPQNGLAGRLPEALGDLTALERLDLSGNSLTGPLPEAMARMTALEVCLVNDNELEGSLPSAWGTWEAVREVDLSHNRFAGAIPEAWARWQKLEIFRASEAGLTGRFEPLVSGGGPLRQLQLEGNGFEGEMPQTLYACTALEELDLSDNRLTGILSRGIGSLTRLRRLDLAGNQLVGDLPEAIGMVASLEELNLAYNDLSGAVPAGLARLSRLSQLDLRRNSFTGALPEGLSSLDCWPTNWYNVLDQRGAGVTAVGMPLPGPHFAGRAVDGRYFTAASLYGACELTLLFHMVPDDPACSRVMTKLIACYRDYAQYGLEIVGFMAGDASQIAAYADQNHLNWLLFGDEVAEALLATGPADRPYVQIVDGTGQVRFTFCDDFATAGDWLDDYFADFRPYESRDYSADGRVELLQRATLGAGIDVVLLGDGFCDRNVADGDYMRVVRQAAEALFSEEPFAALRDYFNVYAVVAVSKHEGYFTGGERALGSYFASGSTVGGDDAACRAYALRVPGMTEERLHETLIVVLMNERQYAGTSYLYKPPAGGLCGSGLAVCYFPLGSDAEMFAQLLLHEAGGHGFAKLGDEYGAGGAIPQERIDSYRAREANGWWCNVDFTASPEEVKWSRFLDDARYADEGLGIYEGACTYGAGAYRPTENSIMRDNTGGFNAPSREAIWRRVMYRAYGAGVYDHETFVRWDRIVMQKAAAARAAASGTAPLRSRTTRGTDERLPQLPPPVCVEAW